MNTIRKLPFCKPSLSYFIKKDNRVIVFDHSSRKSYIISYEAYNVLRQLSGQNDINSLLESLGNVSEAELMIMISNFVDSGLVYYASNDDNNSKKRLLWNDTNRYRFVLINDTCGSLLYRYSTVSKLLKTILLCSPFVSFFLLSKVIDQYNGINLSLSFRSVVEIILLFILSLIIHESSHAIIAKCFDADIGEVGVIIESKLPFIRFYVNICGLSYIKKKSQLFLIHLGGVLGNILLICIGSVVYLVCNSPIKMLGLMIILVNTFCVIIDLLPFYSSDGLEIYKDIVAILRQKNASLDDYSSAKNIR